MNTSRKKACGEIAKSWLNVIARGTCDEAIHSSPAAFAAPWIASRSLSSGAHSRDPLARNDVVRLFENQTPVVIVRERGRSSIPETSGIEPKGHGVLDTPLSRSMTTS